MTDEELKQWVRESLAEKLEELVERCHAEYTDNSYWIAQCSTNDIDEVTDQILSLKKPDGTPAIGIISDDQKPPRPHRINSTDHFRAQEGMIKDNWVRFVGGKK